MNFVLGIDQQVENFFTVARVDFGTDVFSWIALLGKWQIVLVLTLLILAAMWLGKKREYFLPFAVTVLGSQISEFILKRIFQRPRPTNGAFHEDSFSFPSGHAVVAMAFYGFLMYFLWQNVANKFWRNALMFLGTAIILLVSLSRLYLGLHFFTDVLVGLVVGALWLAIGIFMHKRSNTKNLK